MSEFNVSKYEAAETAILEVKDITGAAPLIGEGGQPVTIEVYGPGSEQAVKADAEIAQNNKTRIFAAVRGKEPKNAAALERDDHTRKLTACTKALNNFPIPGGAKALYENPRLGFIRQQVAEFQVDWANFPNASSMT